MPKFYTTTFRGETIHIASIARWMVRQGYRPTSRNQLLTIAVENFFNFLTEHHSSDIILDEEDALEYLSELGLTGRVNKPKLLSAKITKASLGESKTEKKISTKTSASDVVRLMEEAKAREDRERAEQSALGNFESIPTKEDSNE